MRNTIVSRHRRVGTILSVFAKRIRNMRLTKNEFLIKIKRPEDAALLARISAIANMIDAEAADLIEIKSPHEVALAYQKTKLPDIIKRQDEIENTVPVSMEKTLLEINRSGGRQLNPSDFIGQNLTPRL